MYVVCTKSSNSVIPDGRSVIVINILHWYNLINCHSVAYCSLGIAVQYRISSSQCGVHLSFATVTIYVVSI